MLSTQEEPPLYRLLDSYALPPARSAQPLTNIEGLSRILDASKLGAHLEGGSEEGRSFTSVSDRSHRTRMGRSCILALLYGKLTPTVIECLRCLTGYDNTILLGMWWGHKHQGDMGVPRATLQDV